MDRAVEAKRSRIYLAVGFHLPKVLSRLRPSPIQSAQLHENIHLGTVHRAADRVRDEVAFVPLSAERGLRGAHPTFATDVVASRTRKAAGSGRLRLGQHRRRRS